MRRSTITLDWVVCMPGHEEHCAESMRKYGKRFDKLHTWMDEPWEILGRKHRRYRHDPYTTPEEAKKTTGNSHHLALAARRRLQLLTSA